MIKKEKKSKTLPQTNEGPQKVYGKGFRLSMGQNESSGVINLEIGDKLNKRLDTIESRLRILEKRRKTKRKNNDKSKN